MKQKIVNGVVIVIIVAAFVALLFPWPQDFNKEFSGVKYQLNQSGVFQYEKVKVSFSGEYHSSYFGLIEDRFTGHIQIDGVEIYKNKDFELRFSNDGSTIITHRCFVPEQMVMKEFYYGKLHLDDNLCLLVIELFNDYDSSGFNKQDGFIIVAPAGNIEEAIEIVNVVLDK
ncbi:MAG: hypothetical protein R3232_00700 [Clostridia bacterium]|nr:hypothetical protein [Clostridia bacterium]